MTEQEQKIISQISSVLDPVSSIGIHAISYKYTGEAYYFLPIVSSILDEGLRVSDREGDNIAVTCKMLGTSNYCDKTQFVDYSYAYDDEDRYVKVVIAIPGVITDSNEQDYFLGFAENGSNKYDSDLTMLPINKYIMNLGYIPKEFIVGYITGKMVESPEDACDEFVLNEHYIGTKSNSERAQFFDKIKPDLIACGAEKLSRMSLLKKRKK